ncbi:MAG TPA: hypothetical protein VFY65_16800, partial [Longimicrobium sp.]|nr:hypothetical protein [Longimicrobium sp.]
MSLYRDRFDGLSQNLKEARTGSVGCAPLRAEGPTGSSIAIDTMRAPYDDALRRHLRGWALRGDGGGEPMVQTGPSA